MPHKSPTVLRIDASMRRDGSVTRDLADRWIATHASGRVIVRDLAETPLPQVEEGWIAANFTDPAARDAAQDARLVLSDSLIDELKAADTVVIGLPIYNFGVPAALKAWVDLVARAGVTFRYTPDGPVGLLHGKRAVLLVASGGTAADSEVDFATPHMRQVLRFLGITDVEVVAADRLMVEPARRDAAMEQIDQAALAA